MKDRKIANHFWLSEFTKSQNALRYGLDNTPNAEEQKKLEALAKNVLDKVRDKFGIVNISSGFRSIAVNRKAGSGDSSQHRKGEAADFEIFGVSNYEVACWIRDNLDFDQLILEFYTPGQPNSGWVHVSYKTTGNRKKCNTAVRRNGKTVYLNGLVK